MSLCLSSFPGLVPQETTAGFSSPPFAHEWSFFQIWERICLLSLYSFIISTSFPSGDAIATLLFFSHFVEEVTRVDFFGEINGQEWRARGSFTTEKHIHETSAIRLVYPEYKPHNFPENHRRVSVQLVLKRGGKEYKSKPVDFFYLPGNKTYYQLHIHYSIPEHVQWCYLRSRVQ